MTGPTYTLPVGTVLRFPNGHTVALQAGEHVNVPAGTIVEGTPGGEATHVLAAAGVAQAPAKPATGTQSAPPKISTVEPAASAPQTPASGTFTPWQHTRQGATLQGGYAAWRASLTSGLPSAAQSMRNLAKRPIGG